MKSRKVISIANQKGGVAKTFSTCSICYELGKSGYKVLVIDCDPQANLTASFGIEPRSLDFRNTLSALMTDVITFKENVDPSEYIMSTEFGVDIIPTSSDMRGIDKTIEQREMRKEYVLQEIVEPLRDNYDFIFLDSPPTFSNLTLDILVASDSVMIPLDTSESASRGMLDLIGSIQRIQKYFNKDLSIDGIFFARVSKGTVHATETMESIRRALKKNNVYVYKVFIPSSVRAMESISERIPIGQLDPSNAVSVAYRDFTKEFLERIHK